MSLLGWVIFALAMVISLMLHESGHFLAAKRFRMKATRYFIGFGPTLWSTRRGETEYGVKALPLGAFVKIVGMTSLDEVDPEDEPRAMRSKPRWQRATVLAAGSFTQFALAFGLLFGLALGVGLRTEGTTALGAVGACVPAGVRALNSGACVSADPASPARRAGLRAGDTVVAVDGAPVRSWAQLASAVRRSPAGRALAITVRRRGRTLTVRATLARVSGSREPYLGISPEVVFQSAGPLRAAEFAGGTFGGVLAGSAKVVMSLPTAIPDLFARNRASTAGGQVTSVVGAAEVTGAVVSAQVGWRVKATYVVLIIASLNIFIGLFNLLPLPPLDGGHIAVIGYERVRAWLARLRGRPEPGPADMAKLVPVTITVFAVIVVFSLVLILADIVNPVGVR